jgi:hypothetical protein
LNDDQVEDMDDMGEQGMFNDYSAINATWYLF